MDGTSDLRGQEARKSASEQLGIFLTEHSAGTIDDYAAQLADFDQQSTVFTGDPLSNHQFWASPAPNMMQTMPMVSNTPEFSAMQQSLDIMNMTTWDAFDYRFQLPLDAQQLHSPFPGFPRNESELFVNQSPYFQPQALPSAVPILKRTHSQSFADLQQIQKRSSLLQDIALSMPSNAVNSDAPSNPNAVNSNPPPPSKSNSVPRLTPAQIMNMTINPISSPSSMPSPALIPGSSIQKRPTFRKPATRSSEGILQPQPLRPMMNDTTPTPLLHTPIIHSNQYSIFGTHRATALDSPALSVLYSPAISHISSPALLGSSAFGSILGTPMDSIRPVSRPDVEPVPDFWGTGGLDSLTMNPNIAKSTVAGNNTTHSEVTESTSVLAQNDLDDDECGDKGETDLNSREKRRLYRKNAEKLRRDLMKDCFDEVKNLIPKDMIKERAVSKEALLARAVDYICKLKDMEQQKAVEIKRLEREVAALQRGRD
ncbi:hypothetical protein HDU78_005050, partial [Chytriomyces hyalinus]